MICVELVKLDQKDTGIKKDLSSRCFKLKVGDSEKKVVSCLSAKWFYKTLKNG